MNDSISRADVEQTVEDNILCYTHSDRPIDQDPDTECHKAIRTALRMLRKDLRKLPSAQPEQKTARWVRMKDSDDGYCSNCKCDMPLFREDWESWKYCATEFCPNCGAKMVNWEGMEGEAE